MLLLAVTVTFVALSALPVVSWLPVAFTPGKLISAPPLKLTPPIVLALANIVAVAALPVVSWLPVAFTPGKLISAPPLKLTPPIVLALANVVAVVALPLNAPEKVVAVTLPL